LPLGLLFFTAPGVHKIVAVSHGGGWDPFSFITPTSIHDSPQLVQALPGQAAEGEKGFLPQRITG
jgi:hypothetical protein